MRILLVDPPLQLEERYGKILKIAAPKQPTLGLAYIAAVLENEGHYVKIIDAPTLEINIDGLKNIILRGRWDIVGMHMTTPMYTKVKETSKMIKSVNKDIKIIVGGAHPTIMPKNVLDEIKEIDFCVIGEGEVTIKEIVKAIEDKKDFVNVKGIAFREGKKKKVVITEPRPYIKNIDDIPMPARHLLPMNKYIPAPLYYRKLPAHHIITTRGCPFNCIFCAKQVFGNYYREHSPQRVADEIELLVNKYNAKSIMFWDDLFAFNSKRVKAVCDEIIKRGLHKKIEWSCNGRINVATFEMLKNMKKAGCWLISYGIESGSQRILDYIKKDIKKDQIRKVIKMTQKVGIQIVGFFMLSHPTETDDEAKETINFANELDIDVAEFTTTVPFPGTKLYQIAKQLGSLHSNNWDNYQPYRSFTNSEPVYLPKGKTPEDLARLHKLAIRKFYLRPSYILKRLFKLSSIDELRRYARGAIAVAFS